MWQRCLPVPYVAGVHRLIACNRGCGPMQQWCLRSRGALRSRAACASQSARGPVPRAGSCVRRARSAWSHCCCGSPWLHHTRTLVSLSISTRTHRHERLERGLVAAEGPAAGGGSPAPYRPVWRQLGKPLQPMKGPYRPVRWRSGSPHFGHAGRQSALLPPAATGSSGSTALAASAQGGSGALERAAK